MRSISIFILAFCTCLSAMAATQALAESPLEGPLLAPGDAPAAHGKPSTRAKPAHKKHAALAKPTPKAATEGYDPTAVPAAQPGHAIPNDPVSFGMKWNGSNDSARDTRVQNYNGDAAGTGAELGMKLHF